MIMDFAEKRRFPRFDSRISIRYRKIPQVRLLQGTITRNISKGGLMMRTFEFLPHDARLTVEMALLEGMKPVQGTCRVAWVRKAPFGEQYDTGVEFVNLNQGDPERIGDFIAISQLKRI